MTRITRPTSFSRILSTSSRTACRQQVLHRNIRFFFSGSGITCPRGRGCRTQVRTKMLQGQAATQQCFTTSTSFGGLLPSDFGGTRLPPAGAPNHVLSLGAADGQLAYWNFHVDWANPSNTTWTGPTVLNTAAFSLPCANTGGTCVSQSGQRASPAMGARLSHSSPQLARFRGEKRPTPAFLTRPL